MLPSIYKLTAKIIIIRHFCTLKFSKCKNVSTKNYKVGYLQNYYFRILFLDDELDTRTLGLIIALAIALLIILLGILAFIYYRHTAFLLKNLLKTLFIKNFLIFINKLLHTWFNWDYLTIFNFWTVFLAFKKQKKTIGWPRLVHLCHRRLRKLIIFFKTPWLWHVKSRAVQVVSHEKLKTPVFIEDISETSSAGGIVAKSDIEIVDFDR